MNKQIDPFPGYRSIPSTMHPYNYCSNNPVNYVDPLGMDRYKMKWTSENTLDLYIYGNPYWKGWRNEDLAGYYWLRERFFVNMSNSGMESGDPLADKNEIQLDAGDFVTPNQEDRAFHDMIPKPRAPRFSYIRGGGLGYNYNLLGPNRPVFLHPGVLTFSIPGLVAKGTAQEAWKHREEIDEIIETGGKSIEGVPSSPYDAVFWLQRAYDAYSIIKGSVILFQQPELYENNSVPWGQPPAGTMPPIPGAIHQNYPGLPKQD